jgi:hypothetical protein
MKSDKEAVALFESALKFVESKSIQAWAQTAHNKPLWVDYCKLAKGGLAEPHAVGCYITCLAIGL